MNNLPLTKNKKVLDFVLFAKNLCSPDNVIWIDGSKSQLDEIRAKTLESGELIELNQELLPNCYLHRSAINDVARVENRTFICSEKKEDAGPTNNWMAPNEAKDKLSALFKNSMKGRTMFVIPFSMGVVGSKFSKVGIEITDSAYVVLNMAIMTRVGKECLDVLGDSTDFVEGLHCTATLTEEERYICHFPLENAIWSVNSGYGGNALLGKKCFALRIASTQAKREGWLAEHMLIVGIERTGSGGKRETKYIAAAFPSQCGKTNLAMLVPPKEYLDKGYKVFCVGDDIAWLRIGKDGRLWAVNPENGFFGVAVGTSMKTNPNAMKAISSDTIFTNVVQDLDNNTVWWEGMGTPPPTNGLTWKGEKFDPNSSENGAHANSRFTVPAKNCHVISEEFENPEGVPISAIVFGGRRQKTIPLVYEAFDWEHGVFMGASMGSTTTAAQQGAQGVTRRDPMAMLPFIGYHVGDYLKHWLEVGKKIKNPPKIFNVNWFRKDENDKFIWPGFGENLRVLDWIIDRCEDSVQANKTKIGLIPFDKDININGIDITSSQIKTLLEINDTEWSEEFKGIEEFFDKIDEGKLPKELKDKLTKLKGDKK
ncbi:MAG: phosphoenolpyruvate carboxykinase (GTP) [Firmicutes bacterium]|nr:phosphoenolpyruvate carboxykinase (GTP) [Bacillota bacterium]